MKQKHSKIGKWANEIHPLIRIFNRFSSQKYVPKDQPSAAEIIRKLHPENSNSLIQAGLASTWLRYQSFLKPGEFRHVAYVGANDGTTSLELDAAFPGMKFVLLEPVQSTFQSLKAKTAGRNNMTCLQVAAGRTASTGEINVDEFNPASSLLAYDKDIAPALPELGKVRAEQIVIKPLDTIIEEVGFPGIDLLLIDVQGFEDEVLAGATKALTSCKAVISEMTLRPIYQNGSTFDSVYRKLSDAGFTLRYLHNACRDNAGLMLQLDGVFLREKQLTGKRP